MSGFTRFEVIKTIYETKIIPVFFDTNTEKCIKIIEACHKGGIRVIEFVHRADYGIEVFASVSKYMRSHHPEMIIGAGTITDAGSAALYMQYGADFIVSPSLMEEVAIVCNRKKLLYIPACGTLTEISKAESMGAEFIKLFPGSHYKPDFVSAVKAPCPWTNFIVTGGVEPTEASLKAWFGAGVSAVGMGSKLIGSQFDTAQDFDTITHKCKACVEIVNKLK
ncbi:MAG: bifunctional 4-hydroxy-2-oxoglutarate aldolase/2-dehydro-3-deoxy-phosphogluconate aldolase [Cytophagales bacterium]|nr:bifunctional 4-hydroxy-2-oxoglutarate aldolase/2-dehydro-3-deoxy-phosphogluconate aldolase [Cytophagales bacterium]